MKIKLLYPDFDIPYLLAKVERPIGGAAVEWYVWIRAFRKIGCEFGLLTWDGSQNLLKNQLNFDLVESYKLNKGIPKIRRFTYRIPKLFWATKKYNPDFIIQECADEYTGIMAMIAKILGKPFIHRIASDMDVDGRAKRNFSLFTRLTYNWGLKRALHISCQNKYQFDILKNRFPQKSISVLHNPYFFNEKNINKDNSKKYIAWIGNFRYEKNLPALAKIAEKLSQYKFKIAGTKFPQTDNDTAKGLEKLEKLSNVQFMGHISNDKISDFLSEAYCLLNTSRLEGFSNTFLEAWAAGVPVITTKNVNPDNLITDYNLGKVVNDYTELTQVLDNFIRKNEYIKYEEICTAYVKEKHDPIKLAKQFLNEMINSKTIK